jgi:two-component system, OmpR family, sensor kinase
VPFVQAINRLLARIGELLQQQRRFVADAAHELRSPLTALGLQLQNLRGADSLSEMQQRLQPLQQGVQRATQLTAQLLNLARSQAGAGEDEQVDVPALARQLLAEFQPLAGASRIDLGLQQEAAFCLNVPREGLHLILSNALENALRYTPAGGEVTLRLACESAAAVMEVIDSGPGIPAAQFDRVFDPFFRVPGSPGNGSGLGLSIARESAIRLGGSLTLLPRQAVSGLVFRYRHPLPANAEG